MFLVDTHCHINFKEFKDDADEVIKRSIDKGISLICVGSQSTTSKRALDCANEYDGVWAAVGLHPVHLSEFEFEEEGRQVKTRAEEFDYDFYKNLLSQEKAVALGEMGLDYYRIPSDSQTIKQKQREVFRQGIALARELDKPMIIHTRQQNLEQGVYEDILAILKQEDFNNSVVHCFSGDLNQARAFVDQGCKLSFTGIVTFKNARQMQEVAKAISLESMMLETDAPYLAPEPHRGQRNEPAYVEYIARKIAELKNISFEEVAKATTENARSFFKLA